MLTAEDVEESIDLGVSDLFESNFSAGVNPNLLFSVMEDGDSAKIRFVLFGFTSDHERTNFLAE